MKKWSVEDGFSSTVRDVFGGALREDIDNLTHTVSDCSCCVETTVPTRTICCFSTNKLLITPDIKAPLKEKKRAFASGNTEDLRTEELRRRIGEGKRCSRKKLEEDASEQHQEDQNEEDEGKKGSDGISSRLQISCVDHLFGISQHLKEPNIYRAVPLTSHQDPSGPHSPAAAVLLTALQQSGGRHRLPPAQVTLSPGESWEH